MANEVKYFDLSELVHAVRAKTEGEVSDIDETLKTALNIIKAEVATRGYVTLNGFGSFSLKTLQAENGIDPHGNPYSVPARVTVEFNPFKPFREVLTAATGAPAIL